MGSRNTNGTKINQQRHSIRNVGGAQVSSKDKAEQSIVKDGKTSLGTTPSVSGTQTSVVSSSTIKKVTNSPLKTVSRKK